MGPLLHRCNISALKGLRRIPGSVVHLERAIGGTYCQRRGAQFQQAKGSRSIPLDRRDVARDDPREFSGEDSEWDPVRSLSDAAQDYEKGEVIKFPPIRPIRNENMVESTRAAYIKVNDPGHPDAHVEYIKIGKWDPFHPVYLRDACTCEKCVDPSSKQKNFQTTDIPKNIKAGSLNVLSPEGIVEIVWENDIPGFEPGHKSIFPRKFFEVHSSPPNLHKSLFENGRPRLWNKETITRELEYVNYEEYMNTDEGLFRAVRRLHLHGLLLVRGVPESEKSVEEIALRIGNLRDTFYGRTWDVKSVPQAKNVAYTAQYLGLHMDLLYMSDPPGFQLLHCLQNTCEGGSSLFSDAFWAASRLSTDHFFKLTKMKVAYHYHNAGEHYHFRHPVIEVPGTILSPGYGGSERMKFVNYSPPFQSNHVATGRAQQDNFPFLLEAMREFAALVESEENLYEYRLQEGECVIFNNRRVLHGRRQFDTSAGSRWLKGAYIDTDVFMSRYRVLSEKFAHLSQRALDFDGQRLVNPDP